MAEPISIMERMAAVEAGLTVLTARVGPESNVHRDVLVRLRREHFVAGGEMSTTQACALIDECLRLFP